MKTPNQTPGAWRFAHLLLLLALSALVLQTLGIARERIRRSPRFAVHPGAASVLAAPPWLSPTDLASIEGGLDRPEKGIPFFADALPGLLREGYERSPWVRDVVVTEGRYPNRARLAAELRKPVAGVLVGGRIVLLDEEGVRLPGDRERPPEGLGRPLRRLVGVEGGPPPAGETWSPAVGEGVAVAVELNRLPFDVRRGAGFGPIDISLVPRGGPVLIGTASGAVVEWGRSLRHEFGELGPGLPDKIGKLVWALERYPGLEGLDRVKLQFDGLTVRESTVEARGH